MSDDNVIQLPRISSPAEMSDKAIHELQWSLDVLANELTRLAAAVAAIQKQLQRTMRKD